MKVRKSLFVLIGISMLFLLLCLGFQPAVAAPSGEVTVVMATFGHEIPIPRFSSNHDNNWLSLMFDPLVGSSPDGVLNPDYGLTEKWEMSPDGLTWTFYLRKGVLFHDGVEMKAKDVKFCLDEVVLPDSRAGQAGVIREMIKSVEVKDPYTVVVHCKKPSLYLPFFLSDAVGTDAMIIPKDYYEKIGRDGFQKKPIGTGPYRMISQVIGSSIKLEAVNRAHWYAGIPKYKYMTYLVIPEESARASMLKIGDADIATVGREKVKELEDAGLNILSKPGSGCVIFHANMQWTSKAFSDLRFRKALNLSINRESIIKHLLAGAANNVAAYPGSFAATCGGDTTLKPYPYDPEEAKRLLKESGFEGYEFTFVSYPRRGFPEHQKVIEAVAGYWQKIGLKPKIKNAEYSTFREKWRGRKTQNTVHGYDASVGPGCGLAIRGLRQKLYGKSNRSVTQDPYIDKRFEKVFTSLEIAEVEKLIGEIYKYSYDQHLMVPIAEINELIAVNKRLPKWYPGLRRNERNLMDLVKQQ